MAELKGQVDKKANAIAYFTDAALKEADELQRNAIATYEGSETGIAELVQSLNTARDIRKRYIEAVHDFNVSVLELELFTE